MNWKGPARMAWLMRKMKESAATKAGERPVEHRTGEPTSLTVLEMPGLVVHRPVVTACKHGDGPCDVCGTSERADRPHTTVGGRGLVARPRER